MEKSSAEVDPDHSYRSHLVMSRNRFELIFWMLQSSHTTTSTPKRIDKIRMLLDILPSKFQAKYIQR